MCEIKKGKYSTLPAFHISILEVAETALFEIFVLMNEVSSPFPLDVLAFPSLYRFFLNLSDHRQICKPEKEKYHHNAIHACIKSIHIDLQTSMQEKQHPTPNLTDHMCLQYR